jgi:hypothetical protein
MLKLMMTRLHISLKSMSQQGQCTGAGISASGADSNRSRGWGALHHRCWG